MPLKRAVSNLVVVVSFYLMFNRVGNLSPFTNKLNQYFSHMVIKLVAMMLKTLFCYHLMLAS